MHPHQAGSQHTCAETLAGEDENILKTAELKKCMHSRKFSAGDKKVIYSSWCRDGNPRTGDVK